MPDAAAEFSSSAVLPVLDKACQRAGLTSGGAELLRFGENAIYQLAEDPVVVRIARSSDRLPRAERELCVARWLAAANVPAVRVSESIEQPLLVDGHPVSFWRSVTGGPPTPTHADLACLLAAFHSLPDCPCALPRFEPLRTSETRLAEAPEIEPDDRDFLLKRCADLNEQFQSLEFTLPPGPIHGDAHTSNLLTDHGQVVLLDFEAVAAGPREWDLVPTAVACERFRLSKEHYREFADTYGFDVRTWAGYPVLREIRELTMTTWLMQNVGESAAVAAEFALRVASLRERDTRRVWNAFDEPAGAPALETGAARISVRQKVRVTNLYATPWHLADSTGGHELPRFLDLGRLEHHYRLSADQLPRVLYRETLDAGAVIFQRWQPIDAVAGGWAWFFQLPSGQLVAALTVDVHCGLGEVIDLLEDGYYGDMCVGGTPVEHYAQAMAVQLGAEGGSAPGFLSERHQIVFSPTTVPENSEDLVQRLIYRADLPYRKDYSAIRYPAELNRRPGWLVAVGPYVSVVCGQQNYVENAIFVSAVQGVGAAAQLRAIRQAAYADVRLFRSIEGTPGTTQDRRRALEQIADQLGDLELELSYSVEASADLGLLVPSLRTESFHNALYESIGLAGKAATAERMLERLGSAISAELTAIESIERRADDNRRVRYAVAVGFLSAVAIPASLILTFLGINASQVNSDRSMFSAHYLGMYIAVAALIVIGVALSLGLWIQHRRNARHQRTSASRPRWTAAPEQPHS